MPEPYKPQPGRATQSTAPAPGPAGKGRFAPSPTGPLHLGSLVAALGSFVDARAHARQWRLRIDDLDSERVRPGARDGILRTLEAHGLEWDGPVVEQSARLDRYAAALAELTVRGCVYPCTCSRRQIEAAAAATGPLGPIYPGTCRQRARDPALTAARRLRLDDRPLTTADRAHGMAGHDPAAQIGDVLVWRRDDLPAYHLATTIDDADMGVTDVVRGSDLLAAAAVQVAIEDALGLPPVRWLHLPLARTANGDKLSKQTGARALEPAHALPSLLTAWRILGQAGPAERPASVGEFLAFAVAHWSPASATAESATAD